MKALPLLACLAVNATAAPAELKDPATVAGDWHQTIAEARRPMLSPDPVGLNAPAADTITFQSAANPGRARARRNGDVVEVPPNWSGDSRMVKVVPGATPPPGAKPWYYRGQKYWIIPIAVEAGAKVNGK